MSLFSVSFSSDSIPSNSFFSDFVIAETMYGNNMETAYSPSKYRSVIGKQTISILIILLFLYSADVFSSFPKYSLFDRLSAQISDLIWELLPFSPEPDPDARYIDFDSSHKRNTTCSIVVFHRLD